jgi:hypothetical protein
MVPSNTCCNTTLAQALQDAPADTSTPQSRFNFMYTTVLEIADVVGVSRVAVQHAVERGTLPPPVVVSNNQVHLWERLDVAPYVEAWRVAVATKRAMTANRRKGTGDAVAAAFPAGVFGPRGNLLVTKS